jgi:hypothetical protein
MLWKSPLATSTQSVVTEHAVETFKNPNGISSLVGFSLSPTYRMGIGERCAGLEMDETFHE